MPQVFFRASDIRYRDDAEKQVPVKLKVGSTPIQKPAARLVSNNRVPSHQPSVNISDINKKKLKELIRDMTTKKNSHEMDKITVALVKASDRGSINWWDWSNVLVWLKHTTNDLTSLSSGPRVNNNTRAIPAHNHMPISNETRHTVLVNQKKNSLMAIEHMKDNNICVMFNLGRCRKCSCHNTSDNIDSQLEHICGICHLHFGQRVKHGS
jgi:hypothetical protein